MKRIAFLIFCALAAMAGTAGAGAQDLDSFAVRPKVDADAVLGSLSLRERYLFGSGAKAEGPRDIAIRGRSDLLREFEPYQSWTGKVSIASELERYQAFDSANFAFGRDALTLVGRLDRSRWTAPYRTIVAQIGGKGMTPGTPTPIADLGLPSTDGIEAGQLAMVQDRGLYRVEAVGTNATVTLQPATTLVTRAPAKSGLIGFLPIYALKLAKDSAFDTASKMTLLTLETVPQGLQPGVAVGWSSALNALLRDDDYRAPTINREARMVAVQKEMPKRKAGETVVFVPPVTSGQIWSKKGIELGKGGTYAVDFEVEVPGDSAGGFDAAGIRTLDAFAKIPADYPWGAWPALWLYGQNDATNRFHPNNGDELDVFEGYHDLLRGPHAYSGNSHKGGPNAITFYKGDGRWSAIDNVYRRSDRPLSGARRFTILVTPDRTMRFVDGELVKEDSYRWQNPRPAQIGFNLAIGSLDGSGPMQFLAPLADANFASMRFSIRSIAVYEGQER